ncbi:hypothetical protein ABT299_25870 [Spirillospora sp. NPDC000708]
MRWQITQIDGTTQQGRPKSEAGERQVTLDKHTIKELTAHRAHQNHERLAAGSTWNESGFVFTDDTGDPLRPEYVLAGHDLEVVQETLGLPSITIASDTYTSVLPDLALQSAEDAAALLL